MGAERDDTDVALDRGVIEPGLGPQGAVGEERPANWVPPPPPRRQSGMPPPPSVPPRSDRNGVAAGGFDALHAALGAPKVPPSPAPGRTAAVKPVAESQGRSNATYSSIRPHAVPAPHIDAGLDAPPVIVADDDATPAMLPSVTVPMGTPIVASPTPIPATPHPSSGHQRAASPHPAHADPSSITPQSFAVPGIPSHGAMPQPTVRMPDRPHRPRTPTVVVRPRGPSAMQKAAVFMLMLVLVIGCGIAVVWWRAPRLVASVWTRQAPGTAPVRPVVPAAQPRLVVAAPSPSGAATASTSTSTTAAGVEVMTTATASSPAALPARPVKARSARPATR